MSKFNYVILGDDSEIFKISFKDVSCLKNVRYLNRYSLPTNPIMRALYKIHNSKKVNSFFRIPLKNIWNCGRIHFTFSDDNPICFILFTNSIQTATEYKLITFLRKKYNGCKIVWFVQDILRTIKEYYSGNPIDIESLKKILDLVVSYDKGDAQKYGLAYHPTVLSKVLLDHVENIPSYDVYFLAIPKGRLPMLIDVCQKLTKCGVKCGFYILGVPKECRKSVDGMIYLDKPISYMDNLKIVANSKCLLELMQPGAVGYTFRTSEALLYGKILLTDNIAIKNAPFFNENDVFLLNELDAYIDKFVDKIKKGTCTNYENIEVISPAHLLDFVEHSL